MPMLLPPALGLFLDLLRCPTCHTRRLHPDRGALRCLTGHTFDIARHGYASLLTGTRATSGDDVAMVQARDRFLATGGYAPILQAVTRLAADAVPERGTVVDIGCGTGYYLAGVLDHLPGARGLGMDTSARALRSAARAHERAAAATWDVFRPFPLADEVADVVLDVFAPRNPAEFHRVLRPAGRLIVVRPTDRHLVELRGRVPAMVTIDPAKEQRLHRALDPYFTVTVTEQVEYPMALVGLEALDLVGMTPSARHVNRADLSDDGLLPDQVTVSVLATAYQPRRPRVGACAC
ncbi:methyltransferase domain-containing protein [Streptomyces sp. NBC_00264]|nr:MULTISPECIES: methyltransferase domain-containing protein [unclassified Streptomyces]WSG48375.1 methyltransferase domain-containing protein [Streptomyces sp. NBC_01732]WSW99009.1 methyltransferase domain-containing protein [Streptomyces sp. NBC_00987]MCX4391358.1 methyltransferase domain-containing protein [Streptomyces sp. NBC_01767]MCX5165448.1 methyltransferase domain-containing protein [Streptomyces sp. NBC_00305]MCX5165892.1 methyltransferase domain-containing protein [Streptomyces sp.